MAAESSQSDRPITSLAFRSFFSPSYFLAFLASIIITLVLTSCGGGGGGGSSVSNTGGGFTLKVSGGTLNDGSGTNGLLCLATLRNSSGNGPGGAAGWTITITGPGINAPLVVSYDDGSSGSYIAWWWAGFNPASGTYTATAMHGVTTLVYHFTIDATKTLTRPVLNKSGSTISWNPVTGAGSYYYEVTDGAGYRLAFDYLSTSPTPSFQLPGGMSDGSYLVSVYAGTQSRLALGSDISSSPSLSSQENDSVAALDIVMSGGSPGSYNFTAKGGVLYEGGYLGTDYYGLVIWTSLLTNSTPSTPPAGDWNVSVTGPNITTPITFTYPATHAHYVYWDYATEPAAGPYTVTATTLSSGSTFTANFVISLPTTTLPVVTGLTATPTNGGGATVNWTAVPGAASYNVNIWTTISGTYTEIASGWVASNSAVIANNTLTKGVSYDLYVTACTLDMTTTNAAPPVPAQVNMSDNTFAPATFTAK